MKLSHLRSYGITCEFYWLFSNTYFLQNVTEFSRHVWRGSRGLLGVWALALSYVHSHQLRIKWDIKRFEFIAAYTGISWVLDDEVRYGDGWLLRMIIGPYTSVSEAEAQFLGSSGLLWHRLNTQKFSFSSFSQIRGTFWGRVSSRNHS